MINFGCFSYKGDVYKAAFQIHNYDEAIKKAKNAIADRPKIEWTIHENHYEAPIKDDPSGKMYRVGMPPPNMPSEEANLD